MKMIYRSHAMEHEQPFSESSVWADFDGCSECLVNTPMCSNT